MGIHKGGKALKFEIDCIANVTSKGNRTFNSVCVWIGTIGYNNRSFPQVLVPRTSNSIGGVAATHGAYERVGVLYSSRDPDHGDGETDMLNYVR